MRVLIVGAGPAGLLLANYLMHGSSQSLSSSSLYYDIHLIDRGPDPRLSKQRQQPVRSYPVQLQERGLAALREIPGLEESVVRDGIWPTGVVFHPEQTNDNGKKKEKVQKIALDPPNKLFVDHSQLTLTLLEHLTTTAEQQAAEKQKKTKGSSTLSIHFDCTFTGLNLDQKRIQVTVPSSSPATTSATTKTFSFDQLVAADGGKSLIRQELEQLGELNCEQKDLPDRHRNIFLSSSAITCNKDTTLDNKQQVQLDTKCLHGWVLDQGRVRIIAAPFRVPKDESSSLSSQEISMSGALVFEKGHDPFEQHELQTPQDVHDYFKRHSPNSLAQLVSEQEAKELLERPSSSLVTVKCDRLHVRDCVLLLGDAAHAMSQRVGHGCISALQDVQLFCQLLQDHQQQNSNNNNNIDDSWKAALSAFTKTRLEDAHALFKMSDHAKPPTSHKGLNMEWGLRQMARKMLPTWMGQRLLKPLPVELLSDTTLPYRDVLEQSQWWLDRVQEKTQEKQK